MHDADTHSDIRHTRAKEPLIGWSSDVQAVNACSGTFYFLFLPLSALFKGGYWF